MPTHIPFPGLQTAQSNPRISENCSQPKRSHLPWLELKHREINWLCQSAQDRGVSQEMALPVLNSGGSRADQDDKLP